MITIEQQTVIRASGDTCAVTVQPDGRISVGFIIVADPAELIAFALALQDVGDKMQKQRVQLDEEIAAHATT